MEFVKKSKSVIDVKIPEGEVIKITDKKTNNILWEKTLHWMKIKKPVRGYDRIFDRGDDIFCYSHTGAYYRYNPQTWSLIESKSSATEDITTQAVDIDPVSKTLCGCTYSSPNVIMSVSNKKKDSVEVPLTWTRGIYCRWLSGLNRFCMLISRASSTEYNIYSYLVNKTGSITKTGVLEACGIYSGSDNEINNRIAYSSRLNKIIAIPKQSGEAGTGNYPGVLIMSSDGISWTKKQVFMTSQEVCSVYYADELNLFFAIVGDRSTSKGYIYQSSDGDTWTKKGDYPAKLPVYSLNQFYYDCIAMSYSPKKQIWLFLMIANITAQELSPQAFITKDFVKWEEIEPSPITYRKFDLIWSPSVGAFLICAGGDIYKLYV